MLVAIKMDSKYKEILANDQTNIEIAERSSINVVPLGPYAIARQFPLPQDLEKALELDKEDPNLTEAAKAYSSILEFLANFKEIKSQQYWFIMKLLLYLDYYQNELDMEQYSLRAQKIVPSKYMSNNFVIRVPGLSEDRPSVRTRDLVMINQTDGKNFAVAVVTSVGANYITANVSKEFKEAFQPDHSYDISFEYSDYSFRCCHYAVDRSLEFRLLPMLFPLEDPIQKIQTEQKIVWINESMKSNPEQQQAVINIMARTAFPAPYVLFGPPGTGKTSTLVEAISQILKKNPSNRILICTPSNAAADEVALRLLKNSIDTFDIHRMYSMSRDSKDICETLMECSNFSGDRPTFIAKHMLTTKKIVIVTLITCHRLIEYKFRENHFSYVFIDEAGQATEPETLIPVTLMSSSDRSHQGRLHGQLVIAGDPQQLGPSIRSKIAERLLGCSMLERLMNWKLYKKDDNNKFNPSYVTKLVRNYRSHPAILHIPNKLFYESELIAIGGEHTDRAVDWKKLPKPKFPVIFHAVNGKEGRELRSPSVFNSQEIQTTMSYVDELLRSKLGGRSVCQTDIGIVTPYKLQRQKIHDQLGNKNWRDIEVGTVETFQGQEKDIIIISTVRSVLYRHNGGLHIGFLSNPKRFNVAVTRAKALLIVVGNPAVLQYDANWFSFISYCVENGAVSGSKFSLDPRTDWSRVRKYLAKKHVVTSECDPNMPFQVVEEAPVEAKSLPLPQDHPERRRRVPKRDSACEEFPARDGSPIISSALSHLHSYLFNGNESLVNGTRVNGALSEDSEEYSFAKGLFSDEEESEVYDSLFDSNENTNDSSRSSSSTAIERSSRRSPSINGAGVSKISSSMSSLAIETKSTES